MYQKILRLPHVLFWLVAWLAAAPSMSVNSPGVLIRLLTIGLIHWHIYYALLLRVLNAQQNTKPSNHSCLTEKGKYTVACRARMPFHLRTVKKLIIVYICFFFVWLSKVWKSSIHTVWRNTALEGSYWGEIDHDRCLSFERERTIFAKVLLRALNACSWTTTKKWLKPPNEY